MRRALAFVLLVLFIAPAPAQTPDDAARAEALLMQRLDDARAAFAPEAQPLQSDPELLRIARARAAAMAHGAPFAHEDHEGRAAAIEMVQAHFGPYGAIGENIAMETNAGRAFDAAGFARRMAENWLASPSHRENILSAKYDHAAIGVVIVGDRAFAAHIFRGQAPPPKRARLPRMKGPGTWAPGSF